MNKNREYYNSDAIISPEYANKMIQQFPDKYKIIDTRDSVYFIEEHSPLSISIPLHILEQNNNGKRELINDSEFKQLFSSLGITNDQHLFIMDQGNMVIAAKVWWILLMKGHLNLSIVDGGWNSWKAHHLPTETIIHPNPPSNYIVDQSNPTLYLADLSDILTNNKHVLLDVRTTDEFTGISCHQGAAYGGSIPNAISISLDQFFDSKTSTILPIEDLERLTQQHNLHHDTPIIIYCHSGARASLALFILKELLGFTDIKNYNGSWMEYSHATKKTNS